MFDDNENSFIPIKGRIKQPATISISIPEENLIAVEEPQRMPSVSEITDKAIKSIEENDSNTLKEIFDNYSSPYSMINNKDFNNISNTIKWWSEFSDRALSLSCPLTINIKMVFADHWVRFGGFIRNTLRNDKKLITVLKKFLPSFWGPWNNMTLYRGENITRLNEGFLGIGWTPYKERAIMFAEGLNADGNEGGVLLEITSSFEDIISNPVNSSATSEEEQEFIIDPQIALPKMQKIATYQPWDERRKQNNLLLDTRFSPKDMRITLEEMYD